MFPLDLPRPADWSRDPSSAAGILAGDDGASDSWIGQETAYQPFARRVSPLGEAGFRVRERKVSIRVGGEPAFTMSDVQQEAHSSSRGREVVLFEPGSGNRIASIILGVALSLHRNSRNGGFRCEWLARSLTSANRYSRFLTWPWPSGQ
ncbi:unnamed protein product [Pylaiella littoralis]